jgi:integrase
MKIKGLYHMPGSKFLWYRWTGRDGKRRAVSLKTDDLPTALQAVKRIQAGEWIARWEKGEAPETTATKLVEDYLKMAQKRAKKPMRPITAARQKAVLLKFLADRKIKSAQDINLPRIEAWLESAGKSADTRHTYARILHTFVQYLVREKLIPAIDFDIPERARTGRKNWLPLEEVNRVIANSKDPDLTFILLCGFDAGLRKSEIINARVNWFDLDAGLLHAQNEVASGYELKDGDNRTIPLTERFKKFLTSYLAGRDPSSYVLKPDKTKGKSDYRYNFRRAWMTHMKRCGVKCTIHDSRRSFASNRVSKGRSIYKVAKWLGDGVVVVEKSYGHLAPADTDIDI